jgi:hypothetical protein
VPQLGCLARSLLASHISTKITSTPDREATTHPLAFTRKLCLEIGCLSSCGLRGLGRFTGSTLEPLAIRRINAGPVSTTTAPRVSAGSKSTDNREGNERFGTCELLAKFQYLSLQRVF